jgi:protein-arginine kinase activator protein McsA
MDTLNTHRIGQKEQLELLAKIQKLEWLLKECIGLEEYELCSQIRNIIHNSYQKIDESQR